MGRKHIFYPEGSWLFVLSCFELIKHLVNKTIPVKSRSKNTKWSRCRFHVCLDSYFNLFILVLLQAGDNKHNRYIWWCVAVYNLPACSVYHHISTSQKPTGQGSVSLWHYLFEATAPVKKNKRTLLIKRLYLEGRCITEYWRGPGQLQSAP